MSMVTPKPYRNGACISGRRGSAAAAVTSLSAALIFSAFAASAAGILHLRSVRLDRDAFEARNDMEMQPLGRSVEYSDMPDVRRIVRRAAQEQYRWSSIVLGIVTSPSFSKPAKGAD